MIVLASEDHKNIFYRRWDDNNDLLEDLDLIDLLTNNWFSSPQIQGNDFNVHFSFYSSYEDAVNVQNRWTYCNFNDPTVGFPRDYSPSSYTTFQWNSFIRTDYLEKKTLDSMLRAVRLYVYHPNQMKVDVSITTDQYPEDTHWLVASSKGETFTFSSPDPIRNVVWGPNDLVPVVNVSTGCHVYVVSLRQIRIDQYQEQTKRIFLL